MSFLLIWQIDTLFSLKYLEGEEQQQVESAKAPEAEQQGEQQAEEEEKGIYTITGIYVTVIWACTP